MVRPFLALALSLAVWPACGQLPARGTLSERDRALVQAEVTALETRLQQTPDKAAVTYQIARTWAAAKQWPEAMRWLARAVEPGSGIDPSTDSMFDQLRGTREFDAILAAVRRATPPVSHSKPAFVVHESDLVPESLAYDPKRREFYFGSVNKGKVVRCSAAGNCTTFAGGLGTVLGLKAHGGGLWLLSNSDKESSLIHYDQVSARMIHKYSVAGPGHMFNDLAITYVGDVYLTDTRAGAVWRLRNSAAVLEKLPRRFAFANGITLSPDDDLLYVSTFPDGVTVVDLKTNVAVPIARPAGVCLGAIDGLYYWRGALIAIQNAFMTPRVARFALARDLRGIESFEVLERRNPFFDGITTGVLAKRDFYYMSNVQLGKTAGFNPITILRLPLE